MASRVTPITPAHGDHRQNPRESFSRPTPEHPDMWLVTSHGSRIPVPRNAWVVDPKERASVLAMLASLSDEEFATFVDVVKLAFEARHV